jgi:pyruvate kinase
MLADATVELVVEATAADAVTCRVVQPGLVRNRQGVNLPGALLSVAALGDVDRDNARWAASREIDFVGLSFVRCAEEVRELKALLREQNSTAHVIAKIEKPEALDRLEEIVEAADGVMVARGDLGVEIDIAEVPLAQKQIVAECIKRQRPVIIATQMLASMEKSRHPTRAEVTDVANAVLDGADACMLSGETAIGDFPREAVAMMNRIAVTTERRFRSSSEAHRDEPLAGVHRITEAVVYGAARIARQLDARLLVVATRSGATALAVSRQRLFTPVLALSDDEATLRRMCLYSGLTPIRGAPLDDWTALKQWVADWGAANGGLQPGDCVITVAGTNITEGVHNAVEVHQI